MIKEAAIMRKSDNKIWTGKRHSNVISSIIKDTGIKTVTHNEFIQGFVDNDGNFFNRKDAFIIAKACGQLLSEKDPWAAPTLMSEDLY